jgi:hypothetical protein
MQQMQPHESIAHMIQQLGAGGFRQLLKSSGISKHATITPALVTQMKQAQAAPAPAPAPAPTPLGAPAPPQAPEMAVQQQRQQRQLLQEGITQMYRQLGAAGLRQLAERCGIAKDATVTPAMLAQMRQQQQQQQPAQQQQWVKKRRVDKYTGDRAGMVYRVVDDKCRYAPPAGPAGSEFVPCTTNVGAMEGHSFAVGPHGLGYYDLARVPYTALAEPPCYYGLRKPRKSIVKELQRRAATKPYAQCVAEMARAGGV